MENERNAELEAQADKHGEKNKSEDLQDQPPVNYKIYHRPLLRLRIPLTHTRHNAEASCRVYISVCLPCAFQCLG